MAFLQSGNTVIADSDANTVFSNISIQGGALVFTAALDGYGGTISGYSSANPGPNYGQTQVYEKFPFATDSNFVTAGAALESFWGRSSGYASTTNGFHVPQYGAAIAKVSFASDSIWSLADNYRLNTPNTQHYAAQANSKEHGYMSGGRDPGNSFVVTDMTRFSLLSDTNGIKIGDLSAGKQFACGASDQSGGNGFILGGGDATPSQSATSTVDRFPFASTASTTSVGNLYQPSASNPHGVSSVTHGYVAGYATAVPQVPTTKITKFPFAATPGTTGTLVGDLDFAPGFTTNNCHSGATYGYRCSGYGGATPSPSPPSFPHERRYSKFSFASDANATNVGNQTIGGYGSACFMD
jgi:hypothetical protein